MPPANDSIPDIRPYTKAKKRRKHAFTPQLSPNNKRETVSPKFKEYDPKFVNKELYYDL